MTDLIYMTDIHLEWLDPDVLEAFLLRVHNQRPKGILLGGDISTASRLEVHLRAIHESVDCPVWFVLGNHDFYGGSIAGVESVASRTVRASDRLLWLSESPPVAIGSKEYLIGTGGWGDTRYGDFDRSRVVLNDHLLIRELSSISRPDLKARLLKLGKIESERLQWQFNAVPNTAQQILVLTHIPPFQEAAWHEGRPSDDIYLPFFACGATGAVLVAEAARRVSCRITVLCGHTHGSGRVSMSDNLTVVTTGATYGRPAFHAVAELISD